MIYSSLQTRYILHMLFKRIFTLLFLIYAVYILFDYTLSVSRSSQSIPFFSLLGYYALNFIKRLDLLIPLTLLMSTIALLLNLNTHNELVASLSSGRSMKRIVKPIIIVALASTMTILLINQFVLPFAQKNIDQFQNEYLYRSSQSSKLKIHTHTFENGSRLLYTRHDSRGVHDAYFFPTHDEIWHFKTLEKIEGKLWGAFVDRFKRDEKNKLIKVSSYSKMEVPFLPLSAIAVKAQQQEPFENFSITQLFFKKLQPSSDSSKEPFVISSQLYHKLAMPWFCLLVVIAIIPSCTQFSRQHKPFLIYTLSLLGFVTFFTIMDACVILGENNILSPFIAILTPFTLAFSGFGVRFAKL